MTATDVIMSDKVNGAPLVPLRSYKMSVWVSPHSPGYRQSPQGRCWPECSEVLTLATEPEDSKQDTLVYPYTWEVYTFLLFHVCEHVWVPMGVSRERWSPGAGVRGVRELPDMDAKG